MTNILHAASQEQATGNGPSCPMPGLTVQNLIVYISAVSVNLLGYITFKVQHSDDMETWFDVPSLATGNLSSTGKTTISLDPAFSLLDYQRVVWTFSNANSVTFTAYITGA